MGLIPIYLSLSLPSSLALKSTVLSIRSILYTIKVLIYACEKMVLLFTCLYERKKKKNLFRPSAKKFSVFLCNTEGGGGIIAYVLEN